MVDLCSVVPPENFNTKNYFPPGDLQAAEAAGCAQKPDTAGCAQEKENAEEESWQGNYKLGAEDSAEEKAQHEAWAESTETRRMAGGLGGASAGMLVDDPNNPNRLGAVRGTQMNTPQTQHHSVVRNLDGRVEAEKELVASSVAKIQNLAKTDIAVADEAFASLATPATPADNRAAAADFPAKPAAAQGSKRQEEEQGRSEGEHAQQRGRREYSERVARARSAFDSARLRAAPQEGVLSDTEASRGISGTTKGCGPLCQLRQFVEGQNKRKE